MEIPALEALFERFRIPIIIASIGIVLIAFGILVFLKTSSPEEKIEIISSETSNSGTIFADIEGAVQKPGVYELSSGSRVQDLLVVAGGFSAEADRIWVEKTLNRAQKLVDGTKIYIPKTGETVKGGATGETATGVITGTTGSLVNINTASKIELEALWGIGPVTAQKIIDNRPYSQVSDLLTKKILGSNVYQRISEQLTVY